MHLTPEILRGRKEKAGKITALTAYDFPTARILDEAGIDIILVGDSLGMVLLGFESTVPVTLDHMLHHTAAVARAVKHALVVADLSYGTYRTPAAAVKNGRRLMKAGARAVKLEGGKPVSRQIAALLDAGIPVMGHLGMLPQSVKKTGGYKVQGRTPEAAKGLKDEALLLDRLGVFSLVLECIPARLAAEVTRKVCCPTIGIGAGPGTDGQIMVLHDMMGFESGVHPRFVRRYAAMGAELARAAGRYRDDVKAGKFPSKKESYEF